MENLAKICSNCRNKNYCGNATQERCVDSRTINQQYRESLDDRHEAAQEIEAELNS